MYMFSMSDVQIIFCVMSRIQVMLCADFNLRYVQSEFCATLVLVCLLACSLASLLGGLLACLLAH